MITILLLVLSSALTVLFFVLFWVFYRKSKSQEARILCLQETTSAESINYDSSDIRRASSVTKDNLYLRKSMEILNAIFFVSTENWVANDDYKSFWGFTSTGAPMKYEDWIAPQSLDAFRNAWARIKSGKSTSETILYIAGAPEKNRFFKMSLQSIRVPNDEHNTILGIIQDITEEHNARQELKDTTVLLETLLDELPCYVYLKNIQTREYIRCNSRCVQLWQRPITEILGKTDEQLSLPGTVSVLAENEMKVIETHKSCDTHIEFDDALGNKHYGHHFNNIITRADGGECIFGLFIDTTAEHVYETELKELNLMFEDVLQHLPCILFLKDYEHGNKYLISTPLFHERLGFPDGYMIGRTDFDFFDEDTARQYVADDDNIMLDVKKLDIIEKFPTPSGKVYTMLTRKVCLEREKGNLLLGLSLDITELHEKRTALERVNELLTSNIEHQRILYSCLEAITLDDDLDSSIQTVVKNICNAMKANMCGILTFDFEKDKQNISHFYAPNERDAQLFSCVEPMPMQNDLLIDILRSHKLILLDDLTDDESKKQLGNWFHTAKRIGLNSFYAAGIYFDGTLWGAITLCYCGDKHTILESEEKTFVAAAHLIELVLERNRNRRLIDNALKDAQMANKVKGFFLTTLSNELRTPLNAVIALSELLPHSEHSRNELEEYMKNINTAGNTLLRLLNDILDLSIIEADQIVISAKPTRLPKEFNQFIPTVAQLATKKNIALNLEMMENFPQIIVDKVRVRQIVQSLIINALKFTEHGSINIKVSFTPEYDRTGVLEVAVEDTGKGIKEEDLDSVFVPFKNNGDATNTSDMSGLGLAISKGLAEKMGGAILVKSEFGKGSTFTLRIDGVRIADDTELSETGTVNGYLKLEGMHAILVDNISMNLTVLGAQLHELGLKTTPVNSGKRALQTMNSSVPNFVLTDVWMPEMNGYQLAESIRKKPEFDSVCVVAVTADAEVELEKDKFDAILLKPITLESLATALQKALKKKQ